jgi:hypothetical protein
MLAKEAEGVLIAYNIGDLKEAGNIKDPIRLATLVSV